MAQLTRPQGYRVVRELLPREGFGPDELLHWLEYVQRRNERAKRSQGKHPASLLKAAVVIPGRPRIMTDRRVTQKPLFPCDNPHEMSLRVNYSPKLFGKGLKPCRRILVRGLDNR